MKAVELKYHTPGGLRTAFVFTDDAGVVVSETGLVKLATSLRKHVGADHAQVSAFLDIKRPCPRADWKSLRSAYVGELDSAVRRKCTSCTQTAIARKYVKILNDKSGG